MSDAREEIWVVYFRRYSSDEWSAKVFPTQAKAERFESNRYSYDQTGAQILIKHYVEVKP